MTAADPARLRELAERVQRATGDREEEVLRLFCEAVAEINPDKHERERALELIALGAFLDAAASLMPAGRDWHTGTRSCDGEPTSPYGEIEGAPGYRALAANAALALLAAALLALAHDAEAAR
jgi:hypothetical protein